MPKYQSPESRSEAAFDALGDGTRRAIVDQLSRGPASVSDLAAPLGISLPAVVQQLKILESAGLVMTTKVGRVRICRLDAAALGDVEQWLAQRRAFWQRRLDRLDASLEDDDTEDSAPDRSDDVAGPPRTPRVPHNPTNPKESK